MAAQADSPTSSPRQMVILFTEIVDSVEMKARLGDKGYVALLKRHNALFRSALESSPRGRVVKDTGDGFMARFETPAEAVTVALAFQYALHEEPWGDERIHVRIAIHAGTALETRDVLGKPDVSGLAVDLAARVMSLAGSDQILLTHHCFNDARQYVRQHPIVKSGAGPPILTWLAHGPYLFSGADEEPILIYEVGAAGVAPLRPPGNSEKARHAVVPGEEEVYGWRPAQGLEVPHRPGWFIERQLGVGGYGEVWLAEHHKTRGRRVFKFCFEAERLRSFKRELTLFRLLREALGDRHDIARLYEVNLEGAPFYIESEFAPLGDLVAWAQSEGGIGAVPMDTRLSIAAAVAEAVAAAHSVGVLHKDLKPANILMDRSVDGSPRPKITDFGIGILTDRSQLEERQITVGGFTVTQITQNESSRTGTRMYSPPEMLVAIQGEQGAHKPPPFTAQGDVYALGVILYQMLVGDLNRPLAPGWERDLQEAVADPLRREILLEDVSLMADGSPARRLASAAEVAQRIRTLDARQRAREQERRERDERQEAQRRAERARLRLRGAVRWSVGASLLALVVVSAVFLNRERHLRRSEREARVLADQRADEIEQVADFLGAVLTGADLEAMSVDMVTEIGQALQSTASGMRRGPGGGGLPDRGPLRGGGPAGEAGPRSGPPGGPAGPTDLPPRLEELLRIGPPTGLANRIVNKHFFSRAIELLRANTTISAAVKVRMMHTLADLMIEVGFLDGASQSLALAMEIHLQTGSADDPEALAIAQSEGVLARQQGRSAEAIQQLESNLEDCRRLFGDDDVLVLSAMHALGEALLQGGRIGEAKSTLEKCVDRRRATLGLNHEDALRTSILLGRAMVADGSLTAAELVLSGTARNAETSLGPEHPVTLEARLRHGEALIEMNRAEEGATLIGEVVQVRRRLLGRSHPRTLEATMLLGRVHAVNGDPNGAKSLLMDAHEGSHKSLGPRHRLVLQTASEIAAFLCDSGDLTGAASIIDQTLRGSAGPGDDSMVMLRAAMSRLVDALDRRHLEEPSAGHDAIAAHWRARLSGEPSPESDP